MAPTEILANQHYNLAKKIFKNTEIKISLLVGKTELIKKKQISEDLKNNKIDLIIGTHSLFQKKIKFYNLGLIVIDEQHKFGVKQRISLAKKGGDNCDILSMSATPIPRTMMLSFFGDMLSIGEPQNQLIENGSPEMSPHGAFKCAGNNSWIAIAIRNEEDWKTFCHVTKNIAWLKRKEFSNLINRLQNKILLHEVINNWSKKLEVEEIETLLQSVSIPAIKIASISDLKENLHLKYRSVFEEISRNQEEKDYFINTPFIVNNHRIINSQKSPEFGEHNYHILSSILGLSEHEIEILHTNQITGNHIK